MCKPIALCLGLATSGVTRVARRLKNAMILACLPQAIPWIFFQAALTKMFEKMMFATGVLLSVSPWWLAALHCVCFLVHALVFALWWPPASHSNHEGPALDHLFFA